MGKNITKLVVAIVVISLAAVIALFGIDLNLGGYSVTYPSALDENYGVRQGLDLVGGSVITYEAQTETATDDEMEAVKNVLIKRLDALGYTEATVSRQGAKKVRVEIPAISDPEEAVQTLGKTAQLSFKDADGKEVMSGTDVKSAAAKFGPTEQNGSSVHYVELILNSEGVSKFSAATAAAAARKGESKNYIAIMLDDTTISQPNVNNAITTDSCVISGGFQNANESNELATLINSGNLPFSIKDVELRSVGPTLGERALQTSLMAAGIGILLILLFMLIVYRLPGLMADISLVSYVAIVAAILSLFRINLSLPGIAGIILSVGMAVDANVIIFARMNEELKLGKSVGTAVAAGFDRAFVTIMDSNITTLIAAVVLYYFGTGSIKGFAITLGIGTVVSLFSAIFVTKFFLKIMVKMRISNPNLYKVTSSVKEFKTPKIVEKKKLFFTIPIIIFLVSAIALGVKGGFVEDIDFTGGMMMYVDMGEGVDLDEVKQVVIDTAGKDVLPSVKHSDGNQIVISTTPIESDVRDNIQTAVLEKYGLDQEAIIQVDNVSATMGSELRTQALQAVLIATLLMLIYITIRFEFKTGVAAIIALIHDVLIMLSVYAIFRVPMNGNFIACMLTIIGYSINNTIVVCDRIRENRKKLGRKPFDEIVNESIGQTLQRSLHTTITTLITVVLLYIIGVPSIKEFTMPLIVGLLAGTYSSILIAGPIWAGLQKLIRSKKQKKIA